MVLLLGCRNVPVPGALGELGDKLGLAMLPVLPSSFGSDNLRDSVAALLPSDALNPQVDIAEALHAAWLELWYQPKIDARTLALRSAEALVRMRHPHWAWRNRGVSYLTMAIRISRRCRNSSFTKPSLTGVISLPSTNRWTFQSICRCPFFGILRLTNICVVSFRIIRHSLPNDTSTMCQVATFAPLPARTTPDRHSISPCE